MEIIEKSTALLEKLQSFDAFTSVSESSLEWLLEHSEYKCYEEGEHLFVPEQPVNHMQVIMEGAFAVRFKRGGDMKEVGVWETGYITGVLPFSRMTHAKAYGQAIRKTCLLELHKDRFVEMVNHCYDLTQALVATMTNRVRGFTQLRYQDEKLMALGKLSAGLAHELNNPASAMVRSSDELYKKIHATPEKFKSIITMRITPEQTDAVNAILFSKLENLNEVDLSLMEREEQLDDLLDWLEDHEIKDAEDLAETFVDFGLTEEELDEISDIVNGQHIGPILHWIESTLSLEKLVAEIQDSADRIATLVKSVKNYSHMDRGSAFEPIDLHDGIRTTLIMLKHKWKSKNIQLEKKFHDQLPKVKASVGELNQVWTNLIVNAIDAMDREGKLTIETYPDREFVCVDITDTGHGISEENLSRIFDPFFTTKKMGEGTGIGLDIVKRIMNRHKADIKVESQPGKTTFSLCFPAFK